MLERIARVSGGESFLPGELDEIVPICKKIAKDIRNRYTIGYIPVRTSDRAALRKIRVVATAPDRGKLMVRTRTSYLLPARAMRAPDTRSQRSEDSHSSSARPCAIEAVALRAAFLSDRRPAGSGLRGLYVTRRATSTRRMRAGSLTAALAAHAVAPATARGIRRIAAAGCCPSIADRKDHDSTAGHFRNGKGGHR